MPDRNLTQRWCIYIDILGFSELWESNQYKACTALGELMRAIYRIGTRVYPNAGERLFVHQMGDGFAIVSDSGEASLQRPIAIAIALMRTVVSTGTLAAATIAEGDFGDIKGCYPDEVRNDSAGNGSVSLGEGHMTLSSVMGTAFIRAFRLNSEAPSGPFLILADHHRDRLPADLPVHATRCKKGTLLLSLDWVRANTTALSKIQGTADLDVPKPHELVEAIRDYCAQYKHMGEKWRTRLRELLNIEV